MSSQNFSRRVLDWAAHSGRHHLPWQDSVSPYRVWVSEIMLQQTQVSTVIPYFSNFMNHYPDVHALASAPIDAVLHLWTGLGYYARARNLHRSAVVISSEFKGLFPTTVDGLCELPGVGRSTAGAILSLGSGVRAPILDGNVKRVLCRYHLIPGWPDKPAVQTQLWEIAEAATPMRDFTAYTQAMMDLGATVCTRTRPACERCPLQQDCRAYATETTAEYPHRKPSKAVPLKSTHMLMWITARADVLLEKRPDAGIWGGLWSFPEFESEASAFEFCTQHSPVAPMHPERWPVVKHTFSHFQLQITPLCISTHTIPNVVMEPSRWLWYSLNKPSAVGLAAPVKKLLQALHTKLHNPLLPKD